MSERNVTRIFLSDEQLLKVAFSMSEVASAAFLQRAVDVVFWPLDASEVREDTPDLLLELEGIYGVVFFRIGADSNKVYFANKKVCFFQGRSPDIVTYQRMLEISAKDTLNDKVWAII